MYVSMENNHTEIDLWSLITEKQSCRVVFDLLVWVRWVHLHVNIVSQIRSSLVMKWKLLELAENRAILVIQLQEKHMHIIDYCSIWVLEIAHMLLFPIHIDSQRLQLPYLLRQRLPRLLRRHQQLHR